MGVSMDCTTVSVNRCSARSADSLVHTSGVAAEETMDSLHDNKSTRRESLLVPMRKSSNADGEVYAVAISPTSTLYDWTPSNGDLQNNQSFLFRRMCGSVSADGSHSCRNGNCKPSNCRGPNWDGGGDELNTFVNGNGEAERLMADNTGVGDSMMSNGVHARDSRCTNQLHGHSLTARSEWHHRRRHYYQHQHHQHQHQHHQQQCDVNGTGSYNHHHDGNNNGNGFFHPTRTSPFHVMSVGDNQQQQQHRGGIPIHHAHHQNNHHHVLGASRRFHRRRGFGAAAVEAIRAHGTTEMTSPQHAPPTPSFPNRKRQKHASCSVDQDHRVPPQVPLHRSKSVLCTAPCMKTPGDGGDLMTNHSAPASELGSVIAGDNTFTALRLSSIAPFYDCAIQQLILECERRVANASDVALHLPHNQSATWFQKEHQLYHSLNSRSFDMLPSVSVKPSSLLSSRMTLLGAVSTPQMHPPEGVSPSEPAGTEEWSGPSEWMATARCGEHHSEEDGVRQSVCTNGALFALPTDDTTEAGTTPGLVQQLIESIGLHVPCGDSAPMVLIGALVYLSRIVLRSRLDHTSSVTTANWYCLTTISILIATKMYVDGSRRWNECFANATGFPLKDVNKLELDFLFLTDFDLLIKEEEVEAWAEWMESVARRRGMITPLRTFIFGRNSCTPSNATTPMSSFVGEDMFFRSITHIHSGNWPSTPVSLTPANMTPTLNAYMSPGAAKSSRISHRLSQSFALDPRDRHTRPALHFQASPSSLPACDAFNQLPPSPLQVPLAPRRTERLFSIVHAPQEPLTPLSLRQLSMLAGSAEAVPLMPPEQQLMSPVGFFQRSNRPERNVDASTPAHKSKAGRKNALPHDNIEEEEEDVGDGIRRCCLLTQDEMTSTDHRALSDPSFLTDDSASFHHPVTQHHHHHCKGNGEGHKGEVGAVKAIHTPVQPRHGSVLRSSFAGGVELLPAFDEAQLARCSMTTPHVDDSSGRWKAVTQVCEVFDATGPFVNSVSLNVMKMGGACISKTEDEMNGLEKYADSDEEEVHDGFEDDFEDDRDDIFARWNRLPTHSPPT